MSGGVGLFQLIEREPMSSKARVSRHEAASGPTKKEVGINPFSFSAPLALANTPLYAL